MKFENFQGVLCGILAAVTYGANPLFALPLYQRGLTTTSVLFYRFALALALLGGWMLFRREPFRPNHPRQLLPLGLNGVFLGCSSLFLFLSFHHLDVGIAATILFVYPVLVCAIMYLGFGVRQGWSTLLGMGLLWPESACSRRAVAADASACSDWSLRCCRPWPSPSIWCC